MIVYKVVREVRKENEIILESAVMDRVARIQYRIGEWSQAPSHLRKIGYHPVAFETVEHAREFVVQEITAIGLRIYRAEVEELIKPIPLILAVYHIDHAIDPSPFRFSTLHSDWPIGTVMYKRVKLLEKVEIETK